MKKPHRYDELSEERCSKCRKRLKLNVTERKERRPLLCYPCHEGERASARQEAPPR